MTVREAPKNENLTMKNLICPEYFDSVVSLTKAIGGFKLETKEGEPIPSFTTPSIPLKVGYTISKCAELLRGKAIKTRNSENEEAAERFIKLYTMEWSQRISSVPLKTIGTTKFEKVQLLPVTEDLLKVREFSIRTYTNLVIEETTLKGFLHRKLTFVIL